MLNLYERIELLCRENGTTVSKMCIEIGISKSTMSELKHGRTQTLSAKTLSKIADYFGVSVDYLMTGKNSSNIKVVDENNNIVVLDDEALELIDSLRSNPEMRMLFSVSKKATKEDIIKAVKIIEALKDENESD